MKTAKKNSFQSPKLAAPPVFVVGYMHSGTTLLINILRNNSTVFAGNRETKYFLHLPMIRKTFPDLADDRILRNFVFYVIAVVKTGFSKNKLSANGDSRFSLDWFGGERKFADELLSEAKNCRDYAKMFRLVSDYLTIASKKTRWVEKTPTHVFHIDEIVGAVPDALFVEIKRDARDVLASKKTRRSEVWKSDKYADKRQHKNLEKAFDSFWDALSWQTAVRAGESAAAKYPEKFYSVRYEDLVKNPEQTVRQICAFAGMDFEPEMLEITTRNSAVSDENETKQKGIVSTSVGRWQSVLTPAEIAVIQWRAGSELKKAGYEIKDTSFTDNLKIPFVLLKSGFEFFQRSYRRWRLGGWLYFQSVFANYLKRLNLLTRQRPNRSFPET
jgi:hypothetical protein